MKILVLIPAVNRQPWIDMKDAQRDTWASKLPENCKVTYYYGASDTSKRELIQSELRERLRFGRKGLIQRVFDSPLNTALARKRPNCYWDGGEIYVDTYDTLGYLGLRTMAALDEVSRNSQFDYIFRSNTSSYVNLLQLQILLERAKQQIDYGGYVESGSKFWGWDFVNGAGVIMSRKAVLQILEMRTAFDHRYLDDVAIGGILRRIGIKPLHISRPMLRVVSDVGSLSDEELKSHHFRIRTTSNPRTETTIMRQLHERIQILN